MNFVWKVFFIDLFFKFQTWIMKRKLRKKFTQFYDTIKKNVEKKFRFPFWRNDSSQLVPTENFYKFFILLFFSEHCWSIKFMSLQTHVKRFLLRDKLPWSGHSKLIYFFMQSYFLTTITFASLEIKHNLFYSLTIV